MCCSLTAATQGDISGAVLMREWGQKNSRGRLKTTWRLRSTIFIWLVWQCLLRLQGTNFTLLSRDVLLLYTASTKAIMISIHLYTVIIWRLRFPYFHCTTLRKIVLYSNLGLTSIALVVVSNFDTIVRGLHIVSTAQYSKTFIVWVWHPYSASGWVVYIAFDGWFG